MSMRYQTKISSGERILMRWTLVAGTVLTVLCILAVVVFGIAKVALADRAEDIPPQQQEDTPTQERQDTPLLPEDEGDGQEEAPEQSGSHGDTPAISTAAVLAETPDRGQAYIDSMVFFGESTTAHLRSRGVLSGGKATTQVWADASNTMMLSLEILRQKIIYPETGESMTVPEAAAVKKPEIVVLAFGVNGLSGFVANQRVYEASYAKLISAIKEASPETTIILQTVYPVGRSYANAEEVNASIRKLNGWLPAIAEANGVYLADTASVLADGEGMLRIEYAQSDGLHLTVAAYQAILQYLRTHACP